MILHTEFSKYETFRGDLLQTRGNITIQNCDFYIEMHGGGKCVPACHTFPCEKREFQNFIFLSVLLKNTTKLHIFAKFGMLQLIYDTTIYYILLERYRPFVQ